MTEVIKGRQKTKYKTQWSSVLVDKLKKTALVLQTMGQEDNSLAPVTSVCVQQPCSGSRNYFGTVNHCQS